MLISTAFDSGNIEVLSADRPDNIRLNIRKDHQSDFYQWFHFKLLSTAEIEHTLIIENASGSAYPKGWEGYQTFASYDRDTWFRVPTSFDGSKVTIQFTPEQESVFFAYFIPYSWERHLDLVQWAQQSSWVEQKVLGTTLDGREMNLLVIGEPAEHKRSIWITARQHPGETMAEWFVEGMLEALLNEDEPVSRQLLEQCVFYVVPNMNPDGSVRGHLRTNAAGVNLNREWKTPTIEKSPEVFHVLNMMDEVGVDMYLDIHGDENIPYNFIAGAEGIPSYDDRHAQLEASFRAAYLQATAEFQTTYGYDKDEPGKANLTVASNAVAERFRCLAFTVEMPFKDNDDLPEPYQQWSDVRSQQFGRDTLRAILAVAPRLR
ncbi:carboxypeptidase family protein [Aliidiomarina halalkaliphila]|uniref:Carboxypeptidase family protein n=1 Tax=Aliidiomarina halalkaliphila TaxID=2593535 RepID=A0A552X485_9GAMM|nr:carboxypeptidase family protein [Aliidiomarina halalkaliphila]TRW49719.1 carboxypeptidase family protein [Aliidiomarina halalkaliphila]